MFKGIWEFLWGRDLVVYKLRKFLRKLYEGYPDHFFFGYQNIHNLQAGMNTLENDSIVEHVATNPQGVRGYRIKVEGLKLVETWNTERLTLWGIILSLIILLLTIDVLSIAVINLIK